MLSRTIRSTMVLISASYSVCIGMRAQDVTAEQVRSAMMRPTAFTEITAAAVGCTRAQVNSQPSAFSVPLRPSADGHLRWLVICEESTPSSRRFPPFWFFHNETSAPIVVSLSAPDTHAVIGVSLRLGASSFNFVPGKYSGEIEYQGQSLPLQRAMLARTNYAWDFREQSDSASIPAQPSSNRPNWGGSSAQTDSIRQAIDQMRGGPHAAMPPAQASSVGLGGGTAMTVRNNTPYGLTVYLGGPTSRDVEIPAGGSQVVALPAGRYEVAANVSNPAVVQFYGVAEYAPDTQYSENFYIEARAH